MHIPKLTAGFALALVTAIGSATAADMSGADIKAFISGKSVYLETTANSIAGVAGQGVLFYAEDGSALYKTPAGPTWHGTWQIKGDTTCTEWKERPGTACAKYDKTGDVVSIVDATSGQVRARVTKTAPGNAEKIGP